MLQLPGEENKWYCQYCPNGNLFGKPTPYLAEEPDSQSQPQQSGGIGDYEDSQPSQGGAAPAYTPNYAYLAVQPADPARTRAVAAQEAAVAARGGADSSASDSDRMSDSSAALQVRERRQVVVVRGMAKDAEADEEELLFAEDDLREQLEAKICVPLRAGCALLPRHADNVIIVVFTTALAAQQAVELLHDKWYDGRKLECHFFAAANASAAAALSDEDASMGHARSDGDDSESAPALARLRCGVQQAYPGQNLDFLGTDSDTESGTEDDDDMYEDEEFGRGGHVTVALESECRRYNVTFQPLRHGENPVSRNQRLRR